MAIKFQKKNKDSKNRKIYLKNEKKKLYIKYMIIKNRKTYNFDKKTAVFLKRLQFLMQKMPKTKINNYCILTGRDKGVYRDFKLSRHQIRGNFKFLTGLRNSSF